MSNKFEKLRKEKEELVNYIRDAKTQRNEAARERNFARVNFLEPCIARAKHLLDLKNQEIKKKSAQSRNKKIITSMLMLLLVTNIAIFSFVPPESSKTVSLVHQMSASSIKAVSEAIGGLTKLTGFSASEDESHDGNETENQGDNETENNETENQEENESSSPPDEIQEDNETENYEENESHEDNETEDNETEDHEDDACFAYTCGKKDKKRTICHVPPGNPSNPETLCISKKAVKKHFNKHPGDYCGPCISDTEAPEVFNILPTAGSSLGTNSRDEIAADVTDDTAVDTVLVDITLPNSTVHQSAMNFVSGNMYTIY